MTVRPSDEQTERLRAQAEREHRSMQAVVLSAIDEYIERHERRHVIQAASRRNAERYREALDRLGRI
jgi:predicted transcriptional regulator